jgi:hypothetical protein
MTRKHLNRVRKEEPQLEVDARRKSTLRHSMVVPRTGREPLIGHSTADMPPLQAVPRSIDPGELIYRLIRPATASGLERWHLTEAYRCWHRVWSDTLRELDNASRVFSDDFTRQDELGTLFYEERCVGLTCFRWVDISLDHDRNDSYFKPWPENALQALATDGPRICIGSNLTVLPGWRGVSSGFSVKEVLMTLAVKRFVASGADSMAGTMRNDRGMNGLVYQLGAVPLVKDVDHHGVKVDLVRFSRCSLLEGSEPAEIDSFTQEIWDRACALPTKPSKAYGGSKHEDRAR